MTEPGNRLHGVTPGLESQAEREIVDCSLGSLSIPTVITGALGNASRFFLATTRAAVEITRRITIFSDFAQGVRQAWGWCLRVSAWGLRAGSAPAQ